MSSTGLTVPQRLLVLLATVLTIAINALANILPFNGVTTGQVSDSLQTFFVPAGYVFGIWGVIYLLLAAFTVYCFLPQKSEQPVLNSILPYYLVSAAANSIWIVTWHYGYYWVTLVLMLILLGSLIMIYRIVKHHVTDTTDFLLLKLPFSVYLGWISVATIANVSDVLWFAGWNGEPFAPQAWAALLMVVAAVLGAIFIVREKDYAYPLVIMWALIGIGMRFTDEPLLTITVTTTVILLTLVWIGGVLREWMRRTAS